MTTLRRLIAWTLRKTLSFVTVDDTVTEASETEKLIEAVRLELRHAPTMMQRDEAIRVFDRVVYDLHYPVQ